MAIKTCSYRCEQSCPAWNNGNCNETFCLVVDIFWACFFGISTILLLIRTVQFFKNQPKPRFTLKKLIFIFGALGCLIRAVRFALMAANIALPLFFYQLLWMWSGNCFFLMFTLLLMFWANLIRKGRIPFQWLGKKMKIWFVSLNLAFFIIFSGSAFLQQFVVSAIADIVIDINGIILTGSVIIAALYEGSALIRLLGASKGEGIRDYSLVRKITIISISTACAQAALLIHTLVVAIVARLDNLSYQSCQTHEFVFTVLFSIGMAVILIPMADFRVEKPLSTPSDEKKSSPKKNQDIINVESDQTNPITFQTANELTTISSVTVESLLESDERKKEIQQEDEEKSLDPESQEVRKSLIEHASDHDNAINQEIEPKQNNSIDIEPVSESPESNESN